MADSNPGPRDRGNRSRPHPRGVDESIKAPQLDPTLRRNLAERLRGTGVRLPASWKRSDG